MFLKIGAAAKIATAPMHAMRFARGSCEATTGDLQTRTSSNRETHLLLSLQDALQHEGQLPFRRHIFFCQEFEHR
jgi:hypothetical protein